MVFGSCENIIPASHVKTTDDNEFFQSQKRLYDSVFSEGVKNGSLNTFL